MKTPIDIEKLLQWAMREELPKGRAVSSAPWDLITRFGQLGVTVQTSGHSDGFGFVPGAPHADALIVADAISALDTVARFNDASEVLPLFGDLAAIAGDAALAIVGAVFDPRSIILSKAIQSTRPKWDFECPTPYRMTVPFRDAAGAMRERPLVHGTDAAGDVIYLQPRRGRAAIRDGMYDYATSPRSPLAWGDPSMISIGHARAEYVAWFGALISLAKTLKEKLAEYEPTAPAVTPMPWITGQVKASRVLSDGLPPGLLTVKLPLAPKRKAPGRPAESRIESETRQSYRRAAKAKPKESVAAL
jgi:hypothetical protein